MRNYFLTFVRPKKSFERLLNHEKYFPLGFLFILIPILAYTLMYIFLTIGHGAPSVFTPWLNIPKETYYSVNRFLLALSMILSWLAATSVIQILSKFSKGTGTFEQTLSVIALSISIAMWGGPLAVKVVHKLNWVKSILIGVFGFIILQLIFVLFNR